MLGSRKTVAWVASGLLLGAAVGAKAADATNPYQAIVDRNVFGLKPPPPPPKTEPDKPPPPKITLNGITTIFGKPRAVMSVQLPARPPEPSKPQSFILAEGQRDGDLEVLEINEKLDGGTVKVSNSGTVQTLSMDKDGAKIPNTAAAPVPGAPPVPGAFPPPPVYNPVVNPSANPAPSGMKTIPTRQLRLPTPGAPRPGE
jgi:hypothetical protein